MNRRTLFVFAGLTFASVWAQPMPAPPIRKAALDLSRPAKSPRIVPVMASEIPQVTVEVVSLAGSARFEEPGTRAHEVVWMFLDGKGRFTSKGEKFDVGEETIARAPAGWAVTLDVAAGEVLHALRIRRLLTDVDRDELNRLPDLNAHVYLKKYSECEPYNEAIKSAKTTSRTLLPENYVPRMAVGTVETTGPDRVGRHRHEMLEQLFLGLRTNDMTVVADASRAPLKQFEILHIPRGSYHGAEVAEGKHLWYVWMDFFPTKEDQAWLKNHKPVTENVRQ